MQTTLAIQVLALLSAFASAQKPATELAVAGLDPVALCLGKEVAGKEGIAESYGRYHYRFGDAASAKRFRSEPERWGIQWDGACARMGPLSGRGDPGRWTVFKERIYIFASNGCKAGFEKKPERFVLPASPRAIPPTVEALAKGRKWIEKAVAAHGGATAVDARQALTLSTEGDRSGWAFHKRTTLDRSGHIQRHDVWTPPEAGKPGYDTLYVVKGHDRFVVEQGATRSVSSEEAREDLLRFAHREPITLLWARLRKGFQAEFAGEGRVGEGRVDEGRVDEGRVGGGTVVFVRVQIDGLRTTLHLDPKTGSMLGLSWRGRPADGVTRNVVETFTKWKTVDGVRLPMDRTMLVDGKDATPISGPWLEANLLEAVPSRTFERPAGTRKSPGSIK